MLHNLTSTSPLLILDMANNHDGSLDHGLRIIDSIHKSAEGLDFKIAIKFQYRNLPSFIHPNFRTRTDLKYVNRFLSTKLAWDEFLVLKSHIESAGFYSACTPFDEFSVDMVIEHDFDILKIASASFGDWPLLEATQVWAGPTVLSTAGASIADIDRVVTFLQNREKNFALMHCVAAYPTPDNQLQLNRISVLRERYPDVPIGYSTHEDPNNLIAGPMALAKGAVILERHVGDEAEGHTLNGYSSSPDTLKSWLSQIKATTEMLGETQGLNFVNEAERTALTGLRRFAFSNKDIAKGSRIKQEDVFYGIPGAEAGLTSNLFGKYAVMTAVQDIKSNQDLNLQNTRVENPEVEISLIREKILNIIKASGVVVPNNSTLEISHHYGLEEFPNFGSCMITIVNRDYCKKLMISLPGQTHPEMSHREKDETFVVLFGDVELKINGEVSLMQPGDVIAIPPNTTHGYYTKTGCVIEEVSSNHNPNDSFYLDPLITENLDRKTFVKYWI